MALHHRATQKNLAVVLSDCVHAGGEAPLRSAFSLQPVPSTRPLAPNGIFRCCSSSMVRGPCRRGVRLLHLRLNSEDEFGVVEAHLSRRRSPRRVRRSAQTPQPPAVGFNILARVASIKSDDLSENSIARGSNRCEPDLFKSSEINAFSKAVSPREPTIRQLWK